MSTPPPDTSSLQLPGMPMHTCSVTTGGNSAKYETRSMVLSRLANEMGPFFVGPMTAQDFLDCFLPHPPAGSPVPSFTQGMFCEFMQSLSRPEVKWYDVFIKIISPHVPNLVVAKTSHLSDKTKSKFPYDLQPDCSVYSRGLDKKTDFSCIDFVVEFKANWKDPFVDESNSGSFLCPEGRKSEALGQLTAYATTILSAQYRTHMFMVFIVKDHARLIRWDHSGVVVTEAILFDTQSYLFDFFIRYNIADNEARGLDSTISLPTEDEISHAKVIVPEFSEETAFLAVETSHQDVYTNCRFIIPGPVMRPDLPAGCWTRSSLAFDVQTECRVFLKDSWCILAKGIEPEGEIYHLLHEKKVPNISSCLWAGDVGNESHQSQTDKVIDKCAIRQSCWRLTPHQHYRIVLGIVGKKLEKFECMREFVSAMSAALKAHEAAYNAGILHRDISPGNILIISSNHLLASDSDHDNQSEPKIEGGILIDWDLSKIIDTNDGLSTACHHARTGTWQFMAAELVEPSNKLHTFVHDLESFFWVLFWIVLTQVKSSLTDVGRSGYLKQMRPTFYYSHRSRDGTMSSRDGVQSGGSSKRLFLTSRELTDGEDFKIAGNVTLRDLLIAVRRLVAIPYNKPIKFESRYAHDAGSVPDSKHDENIETYNKEMLYLKSHKEMLSQFTRALADEWPDNDKADSQVTLRPQSDNWYSHSDSKRSRSVVEEDGAFSKPPSSKRKA